ncbi:MAG: hypothetical protein BWX57_00527 [Tenericutes bacterium ADurb.Bin024]|nr:MAG: hypothetical protein BWX57_00527 [Tenericutes bacterium ADurb.Bin024]
MKLRKLIWLPLTVLLLNSCAVGKKVDTSLANARVTSAVQVNKELELDTFSQNGELYVKTNEDFFSLSRRTNTIKTIAKSNSKIKASGLQSDSPKIKIDSNIKESTYAYRSRIKEVKVRQNAFYVDGWIYNIQNIFVRQYNQPASRINKSKNQLDLTKSDLKERTLISALSKIIVGDPTAALLDYDEFTLLKHLTDDVTACEFAGNLTVIYKIKREIFLRILAIIALNEESDGPTYVEIGDGEYILQNPVFTEEEISEKMRELDPKLVFGKYDYRLVINRDGYIRKIRTDIKYTINTYNDGEGTSLYSTKKIEGYTKTEVKINEPVLIIFPKF